MFKYQFDIGFTKIKKVILNLFKQVAQLGQDVSAVEIAVVVEVELGDEAGNVEQLHDGFQRQLLQLVAQLRLLVSHQVHQPFQERLSIVKLVKSLQLLI